MSHSALHIDNWALIDFKNEPNISFNNDPASYSGLEIPANKFYFYLKKRFGKPNIDFKSVSKYFQPKSFSFEHEWCYGFREGSNIILVSGDDRVNITVLSLFEQPEELDFDLFANRLEKELKSFSIENQNDLIYNVYVNYSYHLNQLITNFETDLDKKLPLKPKGLSINASDFTSKDLIVINGYTEKAKDYNDWLQVMLHKATVAMQIQMLLPIYFESLIDLAFRNKLKKSLFNNSRIYGDRPKKLTIFEWFEVKPIHEKLKIIKKNCIEIDRIKLQKLIDGFREDYKSGDNDKKRRNKLLHGNALMFQNTSQSYHLDDQYCIGFPDKARGLNSISESIASTVEDEELRINIKNYKARCVDFIDVFDDNNDFKDLVNSISFAHNPTTGGMMSIEVRNPKDLYAPTNW